MKMIIQVRGGLPGIVATKIAAKNHSHLKNYAATSKSYPI